MQAILARRMCPAIPMATLKGGSKPMGSRSGGYMMGRSLPRAGIGQILETLLRCLDKKRKIETAYHEAGHAVILLWLGIPVSEVTIIPETRGFLWWRGGSTSCDWFLAHLDNMEDDEGIDINEMEGAILSLLAGPLAAKRAFGRIRGADVDTELAGFLIETGVKYGIFAGPEIDEVSHFVGRAINIIELCWPQIERVADCLAQKGVLTTDELLGVAANNIPAISFASEDAA